ncbi:unnamed protein product [Caenorhabditis nigoni]
MDGDGSCCFGEEQGRKMVGGFWNPSCDVGYLVDLFGSYRSGTDDEVAKSFSTHPLMWWPNRNMKQENQRIKEDDLMETIFTCIRVTFLNLCLFNEIALKGSREPIPKASGQNQSFDKQNILHAAGRDLIIVRILRGVIVMDCQQFLNPPQLSANMESFHNNITSVTIRHAVWVVQQRYQEAAHKDVMLIAIIDRGRISPISTLEKGLTKFLTPAGEPELNCKPYTVKKALHVSSSHSVDTNVTLVNVVGIKRYRSEVTWINEKKHLLGDNLHFHQRDLYGSLTLLKNCSSGKDRSAVETRSCQFHQYEGTRGAGHRNRKKNLSFAKSKKLSRS